jgi:CRP-like cAMP-binding protein
LKENSIRQIRFQPGQILFHENDRSFHFYIIQEGKVEVFKNGEDGSTINLAEIGEGTSLGEFAMIDRQPRSATARAKTQVSAVEISEEAYQELLSDLPDWAVSVMRGLVDRLRNANDIIRNLSNLDPGTQVAIAQAEFDPEISVISDAIFDEDDTPDLV